MTKHGRNPRGVHGSASAVCGATGLTTFFADLIDCETCKGWRPPACACIGPWAGESWDDACPACLAFRDAAEPLIRADIEREKAIEGLSPTEVHCWVRHFRVLLRKVGWRDTITDRAEREGLARVLEETAAALRMGVPS